MQFNKRGQELSVNTLILIIIGVLILVFLIVGFTIGWKKIFPFVTPANNVKEVVDKCSLACNTQATYDYCSSPREVRVDQEITGLGEEFTGTCRDLEGVSALGMESCPSISCANFVYASKAYAELSCGGSDRVEPSPGTEAEYRANTAKAYRTEGSDQLGYLKCRPAVIAQTP